VNSQMFKEVRSVPEIVMRQLEAAHEPYTQLAARLRANPPTQVLTIARGSSACAAHYLRCLLMARCGRPAWSLPLSLMTQHEAPVDTRGWLAVAISQSGQSPDLIDSLQRCRDGGSRTLALVNDIDSPLAGTSEWALDLEAGVELSVAATKSFIASMVAGALLAAYWHHDEELRHGLGSLPQALHLADRLSWNAAVDVLAPASRLMVVGRGFSLPAAQEAALKLKETCALQAEAVSGAEILHGPMSLIDEGYPLLIFATRGPSLPGLVTLAQQMRERGARVLLAAPEEVAQRDLTLPTTALPELDPLAAVQAFYGFAVALAEARGLDPDRPKHLSKVTRTH